MLAVGHLDSSRRVTGAHGEEHCRATACEPPPASHAIETMSRGHGNAIKISHDRLMRFHAAKAQVSILEEKILHETPFSLYQETKILLSSFKIPATREMPPNLDQSEKNPCYSIAKAESNSESRVDAAAAGPFAELLSEAEQSAYLYMASSLAASTSGSWGCATVYD